MKISVVIVNWNGKHFLAPCLESIFTQTYEGLEVIVVDNGSIDGSVEFIKDNYKEALVVELTENIGFAGGNNRGFEAPKAEYILTLTNDTVLKSGFFEELIKSVNISHESTGMWAPKILSIIDKTTIDSAGGLVLSRAGIAKGRGRNENDKGQYDSMEPFIPSACCALYKKVVFDNVGYFDEDFFAYCEDTDLGLRAFRAGYRTEYVPTSVVYHHYSKTAGRYSLKKAFLVERNHIWVVLKNYSLFDICLFPFVNFYRYVSQVYSLFVGRGATAEAGKELSLLSLVWAVLKAYVCAFIKAPLMLFRKFNGTKPVSFSKLKKKHVLGINELSLME